MTKHHLVFVYGTLRRGCSNHSLLEGARCVGHGKTVERYAMYATSIPFVAKDETVCQIVGEVYAVGKRTLKGLDQLEGSPESYVRERVKIILEDGRSVVAWSYFCREPSGQLVKDGDYIAWVTGQTNIDHRLG